MSWSVRHDACLPLFRGGKKGPDWPAFKAMEENMQSITLTFTVAASTKPCGTASISFWMIIWAIAILDESASKQRARKNAPASTKPPALRM
ncbi:hypothetical protein R2G56_05035 [Nitratireductor aquimarinus]|uniref:Uncharacterized protein n=1 Tax=Nitratireductor aquimarinus TaxID=889300 RepID=A0ABU4AHB5_9HYPH|nr:hypothetical protein [Nitratireductor aquimarinus]MDV6225644.1 hypothetical protein [Nitratireductor aquimarinus]